MSILHKSLAEGRWQELTFMEQMANIGSEVSRALNWRKKEKEEASKKACIRALELLDLTLNSVDTYPQYKELARLRETFIDYFYCSNQYGSSEALWRKYFDRFNFAARLDR